VLFVVENIASVLKEYGLWNDHSDSDSMTHSDSSTSYSNSTSLMAMSTLNSSSSSSSSSLEVDVITKWEMTQTAFIILPFFILISWLRDSRQLSHGSLSGIIAIGLGIAAVIYYGATLPTNKVNINHITFRFVATRH